MIDSSNTKVEPNLSVGAAQFADGGPKTGPNYSASHYS
jgi:hypothetical protein